MWPRRPHTLVTLTRLTSIKRKFEWTKVEKYDFGKIKRIMASDTLSTHPDSNEKIKIHTNASTFQLGAAISVTLVNPLRAVRAAHKSFPDHIPCLVLSHTNVAFGILIQT